MAWRRGGCEKVVRCGREVGLAEAESMGRRVRWGWGASSSRADTGVAAPFIVGFVVAISAQEALQRATTDEGGSTSSKVEGGTIAVQKIIWRDRTRAT